MRIKLVIGEQDKRYLSMLTMFMEQNHMDQVEVQAFSKPDDYSVAPEAPVRNFEQQLSGQNSSALR